MTSTKLPLCGRAQLLRALDAATVRNGDAEANRNAVALALGWERRPEELGPQAHMSKQSSVFGGPKKSFRASRGRSSTRIAGNDSNGLAWPANAQAATFWAVVSRKTDPQLFSTSTAAVEAKLEWNNAPIVPVRTRMLLTWEQAVPRLRSLLSEFLPGTEVDVQQTVERLASSLQQQVLSYRPRRRWGASVRVLVDRSGHLKPYFADQDLIIKGLRRLLGTESLEVFHGRGADASSYWRPGHKPGLRIACESFNTGTRVLVLGDLGCLLADDTKLQTAWQEWGRRLGQQGCQPIALVPCSERWLPRSTTQIFETRFWGQRNTRPAGASSTATALQTLKRLVSICVRLEPGLLRQTRMLIPGADDPALESQVWQAPLFLSRMSEAAELAATDEAKRLQIEFDLVPAPLRSAFLDGLRIWRQTVGCEIYFEEISRLSSESSRLVDPADRSAARSGWEYLQDTVLAAPADIESPVTDYAKRVVARLSGQTLLNPDTREAAAQILDHLAGTDAARLRASRFMIHVRQSACSVELIAERDHQSPSPANGRNSSIVTLNTLNGFVRVECPHSGRAQERSDALFEKCLRPGDVAQRSLPQASSLVIQTELESVTLQPIPRPAWAAAAGRDGFGLWAESLVGTVRQRWRWIPPGSFQMGSPDDEPGRWKDEGPRHWVTLTRGFWMMDTPCTQALWEAVLADEQNPSRFQDADRPVERVSWDDVQRFVGRLNGLIPGLACGLPTEAQWEYACRAGSETALYRTAGASGEIEVLGERNAPALDSIAWYGGNSGVQFDLEDGYDSSAWEGKQYPHAKCGTRKVAGKSANGWGLYDMLGNVWEWCADSMRDYRADSVVDPVGAPFESRAIRGGCWYYNARYVRCACRNRHSPRDSNNRLGFRLVRVQDQR